jgi:hypothetical protein
MVYGLGFRVYLPQGKGLPHSRINLWIGPADVRRLRVLIFAAK